ncbi:MAG: bifunctional 2-polyprenyl-6-hydroxyphenol methylase/3-demethylubiquinol 3-O-methyltransferase UbiG [Steroidobacteraceae bacterium]
MTTTPHGTARAAADPAEVAHFDSLAHRFWDPQGEFMPLHRLNPVRAEFVRSRAALAGARVVDVGCGGGLMAEALVRAGATVVAADLAPAMIEVAQLHALENELSIDYRIASSSDLLATDAAGFDVVTSMEMLEHVPDPDRTLAELGQLLRPGGSLFVSTINRTARAFALAIVGAEYVARMLPRGTHEFERLIRPSELARWARAAGLELRELAGLEFNPLNRQASLSRDTAVNYIAWLTRPGAAS